MRIAVEGCAHGELEIIYDAIMEAEKVDGKKVDLLICCGDFQATRNWSDLRCMAVPDKYKDMGTFYKYYSREKIAPVLTIFIGGNHEASNYLQELSYGGWVAPNIYYLGYASVINVAGIRIAGLSGIYKNHDLLRGHHEYPPYSDNTMRSVYHVRNLEIFRLKQISGKLDVFITHDWPCGITEYGNVNLLTRKKPFLRNDIENGCLGSPPAMELLKLHYPSHWFAAHLHCKFVALVPKENSTKVTKFLALDKCLPRRKFLQILEVEHDESLPVKISYDLEWLTILFLTNHLLSIKSGICYMPGPSGQGRWIFTPTDEEKEKINYKFDYDLTVPLNFMETVEPYKPESPNKRVSQPHLVVNNQTTEFCNKLGIDDPFALIKLSNGILDDSASTNSSYSTSTISHNIDSSADLSYSTEGDISSSSLNPASSTPIRLQMTPLKLPPSKNDGTIYLDDDSIKTPSEDSKNSTKSPRSYDDIKDADDGPSIGVNCKKFKRRNQSIYTDTECST